jgi:hypothetical protein
MAFVHLHLCNARARVRESALFPRRFPGAIKKAQPALAGLNSRNRKALAIQARIRMLAS